MRSFVADLPGGTATTAVQMTEPKSIKMIVVSMHDAAVGKIEISLNSQPQIGTAQPTKDVIVRFNQSATAGDQDILLTLPTSVKLKTLDYIYIHQTGNGNVGNVTFL